MRQSKIQLLLVIVLFFSGASQAADSAVLNPAPPAASNPAACMVPLFQRFLIQAVGATQPETKLQFINGMRVVAEKIGKSNPKAGKELKAIFNRVAAGTLAPESPELTRTLAVHLLAPESQRALQLSLRNKEVQQAFYALFNDLNSSGQLRVFLNEAALMLKSDPATLAQLGPKAKFILDNPSMLDGAINEASGIIDVVLKLHAQDPKYWSNLAKASASDSEQALKPFKAKLGTDPKLFENSRYQKMLEDRLGTRFLESNLTRYSSGSEARAVRTKMVQEADEIEMMTWAFYDDATGMEIAQELLAAGARGAKVRLLVDAQTSGKPSHQKAIALLTGKPGIEITSWSSANSGFAYYGNHRKQLVTTRRTPEGLKTQVLLGGRNPGDLYYKTWDDSEVLIEGAAAKGFQQLGNEVWNSAAGPQAGNQVKLSALPKSAAGKSATSKTAAVNHIPGPGSKNGIYQAHRIVMDSMAKGDEVLIENAYVILDPGMYRAILRAQKRGVKITVLSNSLQSVDEPIVANPISKSMSHLATVSIGKLEKAGVYVKTGDKLTDHTKVSVFLKKEQGQVQSGLVIDMSHNLHPRSLRLEGEVAGITIGKKPAEEAANMIRSRIEKAAPVTEVIPVQGNPLVDEIITRLGFYDIL